MPSLIEHQIPQYYTPAFNEQGIIYEPATYPAPDKYVVTVTIDTESNTFDVYSRPDGLLFFDAKETVSNFIKTKLGYDNTTDLQKYVATTEYVFVEILIETVGYTDVLFSYYAFNACLKENDFLAYNVDEWYKPSLAEYTDAKLFMNEGYDSTNIDDNVTLNTDYWLTFIKGVATNISWLLYDDTNTSVGSGIVSIPAGVPEDIIRINLSPKQIGLLAGVTVGNGFTIEAALNYIYASLQDIFIPTIQDICTKYPVYRLYFLKRNGAIGYKTFEKTSELKVEKKINTVRLNPSTITASGGVFSYGKSTGSHTNNVVSTDCTYTLTLNSDWITEAQSNKLDELFDSPKVWLQDDSDGSIKAVTIKESSYTFRQHINEPLFNYNVNIEFDTKETRQRGI